MAHRTKVRAASCGIAFLFLFIPSLPSIAAVPRAGTLDSSFGQGGVAFIEEPYTSSGIQGLIVDGQDEPVGAWHHRLPCRQPAHCPGNGEIARWSSDGKAHRRLGSVRGSGSALTMDPQGRFLAAGTRTYTTGRSDGVVITRLTVGGEPDTSFGDGGSTALPQIHRGGSHQQDAEGRIVVGGSALRCDGLLIEGKDGQQDSCEGDWVSGVRLARLTPDGKIDATFGEQGFATLEFPDSVISGSLVRVPNGWLVTASTGKRPVYDGPNAGPGTLRFTLVRFSSEGKVDSSFGSNGVKRFDDLGHLSPTSVASNAGRILVAGILEGQEGGIRESKGTLLMVDNDGNLVSTFADDGIFVYPESGFRDVKLQPDGKILVGGDNRYSDGKPQIHLLRLDPSGALDRQFANRGILVSDLGMGASMLGEIALQRSGKILIGGLASPGHVRGFYVARIHSSGAQAAPAAAAKKPAAASSTTPESPPSTPEASPVSLNQVEQARSEGPPKRQQVSLLIPALILMVLPVTLMFTQGRRWLRLHR